MAKLTLRLDDEILRKARETALRERTSVNAVVRKFLTHYASKRARQLQALRALDAVAARNESRSEAGRSRESLHER